LRAFVAGGWTVYPVNPAGGEIEGLPAFTSLAELPGPVTRISLYVPPETGLALLESIAATPHDELYLNPGSESPELLERARALGLRPIQACSIVNIGLRPDMFD
jgi:predicted CoA-binding protein